MSGKSKSSKFKHVPKPAEKAKTVNASAGGLKEKVIDLKTNEPMTALIVYAVLAVVIMVMGIFLCKLPVAAVCVVVVIETLMAACLSRIPLWVHLIVAAAQAALGIITGVIIFMLLCIAIYFAAIVTIGFIRKEN